MYTCVHVCMHTIAKQPEHPLPLGTTSDNNTAKTQVRQLPDARSSISLGEVTLINTSYYHILYAIYVYLCYSQDFKDSYHHIPSGNSTWLLKMAQSK